MMGADYTQWHGIWDLQGDLVEIIRYAGEHGLPEAEAWMASNDPAKFWLYPFYDVPGSVWGVDLIVYRMADDWTTKLWMNRSGPEGLDAYWQTAYANVKVLGDAGLLSNDQLDLYERLYENREFENGNTFPLPELIRTHMDGKAADGAAAKKHGAGLKLPRQGGWSYESGE